MHADRRPALKRRVWRGLAAMDRRLGVSRVVPESANAIVAYHSVGGEGYGAVAPDRFARDVAYLTERYDVVDLPAVLTPGERKRVALTFDDGYRDFYDNALPVLREHDVPATVFVVADVLDDPDRGHEDAPGRADSYLTERQLRTLAAEPLVTVGNHTRTHPQLADLADRAAIEREVLGARRVLEETLDVPVDRFSYPYGSYDRTTVDVVREAAEVAVTSDRGLLNPASDPHLLPRIDPAGDPARYRWDLTDLSWRIKRVLGSR